MSVSNSRLVHSVEPFFWTGQLLDNFRPKDWTKFYGSISYADPPAPGHVTSCLQWLYESCLWTERYL